MISAEKTRLTVSGQGKGTAAVALNMMVRASLPGKVAAEARREAGEGVT